MAGRQVKQWFGRLVHPFRHFRDDADLQEELRVHLEFQAEDEAARGVPIEEARRRARLKLGSPRAVAENVRDEEFITMLESCYRDFLSGLRALRKTPIFLLTTVLTLAAGIGANTAIFTLLYGVVLRSLPVDRPSQLARIGLVSPTSGSRNSPFILWNMTQALRREQHSFSDVSAWTLTSVTTQDKEGTLRMYESSLVSGNAFQVLGMKPYLGRLIGPADDVRGGPHEGWPAVLSYGMWRDVFNGDPGIIGRRITLSNVPVTVAGITPPDFQGIMPGRSSKIFLPLQFMTAQSGRDLLNDPNAVLGVMAIGRLRPGVGLKQANAEMAVLKPALFSRYVPGRLASTPFFQRAQIQVSSARRGFPFLEQRYEEPLLLMQMLVGVVLLLCCFNVSGLMMSKIYSRQYEFAVRTAIGAGRWRLVRQYLTESFVIAAAGAALGAAAAWFGTAGLLRFFIDPNEQEGLSIRPDSAVFLVSAALTVVTTLLFGTLPALRAARADVTSLMKSRTVLGTRRRILGRAFVPVQVALSLGLVVVAGLLSQSLIRIRSQHAGFDMDHITITTPQFQRLPQKGLALLDHYQRMVDRLEQMPGIQAAAVTWYTPMTNSLATSGFQAISDGAHPPEDPHMAFNDVGPAYFRTMQTQVLAGREFNRNERDRSLCMLNQAAANFLFPHEEALGRYVRSTDSKQFPQTVSCRVIGIAEDAKYANMREPAPRTIYFPLTPETMATGNMVFLIRSRTEAQAMAGYRKTLSEYAPATPLLRFATLHKQMDDSMGAQRLITILSTFFGVLALLLSALGLYGMLASSVAQRTSEIGIRLALGARNGAVLWMVLKEALWMLAGGLAGGAVLVVVGVRVIDKMLFGVSAFDPAVLGGTILLLTAVAFAAALIPARRAASVNPIDALRAE